MVKDRGSTDLQQLRRGRELKQWQWGGSAHLDKKRRVVITCAHADDNRSYHAKVTKLRAGGKRTHPAASRTTVRHTRSWFTPDVITMPMMDTTRTAPTRTRDRRNANEDWKHSCKGVPGVDGVEGGGGVVRQSMPQNQQAGL